MTNDARPFFVVVANTATPYRLHLHKRIAREITDFQLVSFFTHETGDANWDIELPDDIHSVQFGSGDATANQGKLRNITAEWKKAARMIQWLRDKPIAAVMVVTYNDIGRLRLVNWLYEKGIPVFISGDSNIRSDRASGIKRIIKNRWLRFIFKRCAAILPFGHLGRDFFLRYGADQSKIHFMPIEPDYSQIDAITALEIERARQRFNLPANRRRFIFSGRLNPEKRVDMLIDAFIGLADQKPDWDLILTGDGPLRKSLEQRVPEKLRDRVRFLGFISPQSTLTAIYKSCDVLILPSDYEPWGLVINEAAACGLAIVASDIVGAAFELVKPGVNGEIFTSGNSNDLQNALLRTTDPTTLARYQSASPQVLHHWRTTADPITKLEQLLKDSYGHQRRS